MIRRSANARRVVPSSGYSLSLILAAAGVTFTAVALAGALFLRSGRDPADASGLPGQVAFACSFGLLFATRPLFSTDSSPALRQALRAAIAALLVIEAVLALVAAALVASAGRPAGMFLGIFVALALVAQAGTLLWLVRYRRD